MKAFSLLSKTWSDYAAACCYALVNSMPHPLVYPRQIQSLSDDQPGCLILWQRPRQYVSSSSNLPFLCTSLQNLPSKVLIFSYFSETSSNNLPNMLSSCCRVCTGPKFCCPGVLPRCFRKCYRKCWQCVQSFSVIYLVDSHSRNLATLVLS